MGIDDFRTSSSGGDSAAGKSRNGSSVSTSNTTPVPDTGELPPWFNVVIRGESEDILAFKGRNAFSRDCRHREEHYLISIEREEQYKALNEVCNEIHDCNLEILFKHEPFKAADFVTRLDPSEPKNEKTWCAVCDKSINVKDEDYTKIGDKIVHAEHRIDAVVESLEKEI